MSVIGPVWEATGTDELPRAPDVGSMDEREPVSQVAPQQHFHVTLARGERLWEMTTVGSTGRVTTGRTNVPWRDGHFTAAGEYRRAIAGAIRQRKRGQHG